MKQNTNRTSESPLVLRKLVENPLVTQGLTQTLAPSQPKAARDPKADLLASIAAFGQKATERTGTTVSANIRLAIELESFVFGRILSILESSQKTGPQHLSHTLLQVEAWLYGSLGESESNEGEIFSLESRLASFHRFFFDGHYYEILHPYTRALGVQYVTLKNRRLELGADRATVTLEMVPYLNETQKKLIKSGMPRVVEVNPENAALSLVAARNQA